MSIRKIKHDQEVKHRSRALEKNTKHADVISL